MDTRLAVAIGVTFGALLLLVSVTWVNTARLIQDARLVDHTKDVIGELEGAFSAIKDGETSQRGYLLTGSDSYLDPYRAAVAELPRRLERISALTADSPTQRTRAAMLRHLTEERLSEMSHTIEMAQGGHEVEARAFLKTGIGKRTMDAIRQLVVEMKAEERALLSIRDRRSSETARTLLTTLGIGCVLLFGFLILIWYLIRADLRRRNSAEAAIREREARIRRLIDANLIGVLFSDDGRVTDANGAFLSMVGIDRESWNPHEHQLFGFTAPEFKALDDDCEKALRETGTCQPYQKELLRTDGSRVPVLFGSTNVDLGGSAPVRASFVVDLSELKRLEAERNRLYEEARDAVKARDAFLSVAGHEIRTPLSALNLVVYQLARHVRALGNERAIDLAARCEKQVARLIRLADELLDVSRISAGTLHLDLEELDLALLAREVAERLEESARRAGSKILVDASGGVSGFWDRLRLEQVLSNLLTNALKFGAGEPVEIRVSSVGDEAILLVKDHGIGIHDEDQRRIFGRFERAVSRETYPGMGLGLWITREIVEAHGGRITVESRPGAGALFRVTLPRRAGETR
ncbi:MAG: CHASE3 domain-containing protein [Acidobacteriota bacterium]|jgi:PAS domain S-box-containing protein